MASPLLQTVSTTPTDYWNDSCSIEELTYAIGHGAVGATTNPNIVLNVLNKEMHLWEDRIRAIIAENPTWSEAEVTWKLIEEMAVRGAGPAAADLRTQRRAQGPALDPDQPHVLPQLRGDRRPGAPLRHAGAEHAGQDAGHRRPACMAIEESTYHGVNVNATVSFTVPQAVAVAEAVERGLNRRAAEGKDVSHMRPVCTIMIGRTDDWMKVVAKKRWHRHRPGYLDWAGIAVFKNAYRIWQERGYRVRLLAAAYRHLGHWSELIGGDVVLTIPYEWQLKINALGHRGHGTDAERSRAADRR